MFGRAPIAKNHMWDGIKKRNLFAQCSGGWKPKIQVPIGLVSSEALLLAL